MSRTVCTVQHYFALSSGLRSQVIWDSYALNESDILREKIKTLIPNNGQNTKVIEKMRETLFNSIWLQRKYSNRTLLSSIIYVMVTKCETSNLALNSEEFSCHPVFRTRKCLNSENSIGCCMIFIDENGRVYKNWKDYIETNTLPKGTMIAPKNGVYTFNDSDNKVLLETFLTPAAKPKSVILKTTDTVAGVGGLIATVPLTAALAFPVAAPILTVATVGTLATAAYTTLRSAMQLQDRGVHGQSIALTDGTARRNWLGVASGAMGIGASGATKAVSYAATTGRQISLGARIAANSMNVSSILLSGSGVANSIYDLYIKINNDEKIDGMDILHLASSMLVFTHSINNIKIVRRASRGMGNSGSLRSELSVQMRSLFERMSRETMALQASNNVGGPIDLIRTVNDIPINDVLQNLHRFNAFLPKADAVIKLGATGISGLLTIFTNGEKIDIGKLANELGSKFVQHIFNESSLRDVMRSMIRYLRENVFNLLLLLTRTFIEEYIDRIGRTLCTFISTESVLYKIFMHCVNNYSTFTYEFLESKTCEILNNIESYFDSLNPYNDGIKRIICKTCSGYYYECAL